MKIEKIADITATLFKEEAHAGVVTKFIADELAKASETYVKQLADKDNLTKKVEEAKASAEKTAQELQTKVTELANKLNEIEEAKANAQAEADFNTRMGAFDAEYDLDDEDRKSLAADVKACKTKEEFDTFVAKVKPLMKEKSKEFKKNKANKMKEQMCASVKDGNIELKVEVDEKTLDFKEIVASVKAVKQTEVPNTPPPAGEETLLSRMQKAFGGNVKLNGKAPKQ
jgi:hypothetical protein